MREVYYGKAEGGDANCVSVRKNQKILGVGQNSDIILGFHCAGVTPKH